MSARKKLLAINLLRRRRELPAAEVAQLLAGLPAILDAGGERPGDLLRALQVESDSEISMEAPVSSWPRFRLVLDDDAFDRSTILPHARPGTDATAQLAGLIYEMLGGPRRDTRDFSPLAAIGEAGNALLGRALRGGPFANCEVFWRAWLQTLEVQERCAVLDLFPADAAHPPVRLVARAHFRIGRSRRECDWPARVVVGGVYDSATSDLVSRVHVVGEWLADGPVFRDGVDGRASANGTTFNGMTLKPDQACAIGEGGILTLGGVYRLEVQRSASAVFFRPLDGRDTLRDAVWLCPEIACDASPERRLAWGKGASRLLHRDGRFWIANSELESGEIAPLISGSVVEIGPLRFSARHIDAQ